MLLIPCPNCGDRDESEFDYGGRAIVLPDLNAPPSQWHQALHLPETDKDEVREYWFHAAGCECWIKLQRNHSTHEFVEPEFVEPEFVEPGPDIDQSDR